MGGPPMIRGIARILWELALLEPEPEKHPVLGPLALHVMGLYGRPVHATTPEEWEEAFLDAIAHRITKGVVYIQKAAMVRESMAATGPRG